MNPTSRRLAAHATAVGLQLAVTAGMAWAQDVADPTTSSACMQSLERLHEARRDKVPPAFTEQARQEATKACLGGPAPEVAPTRSAPPESRVAPIAAPATRPPVPTAPSALPAPVAIDRPALVTNCDASGCWDSEGRRLNRTGQDVIGPRGPCLAQGALFVCP